MFLIGLPILSYPIRPYGTTSNVQDDNTLWVKHASHQKSWIFKSRFSLKAKQKVENNSIFNKKYNKSL